MSVANSYAKALYEAATDAKISSSEMDRLEEQLAEFTAMLAASRELRVAIASPMLAPKEKVAVVTELVKKSGYTELASRFLVLLARKDRLGAIEAIRGEFREARLLAEGGVLGKVVSAEPLPAADLEELSRAFSKKLGKKVAFDVATDSTMIAGVKVTVNGVTYDGTVRSKLQRLQDQLAFKGSAV